MSFEIVSLAGASCSLDLLFINKKNPSEHLCFKTRRDVFVYLHILHIQIRGVSFFFSYIINTSIIRICMCRIFHLLELISFYYYFLIFGGYNKLKGLKKWMQSWKTRGTSSNLSQLMQWRLAKFAKASAKELLTSNFVFALKLSWHYWQ